MIDTHRRISSALSRLLVTTAPLLSLVACVDAGADADADPELATAVSELACTATKLEAFSTDADEGRLVFSPDGRLALFHRAVDGKPTIMESRRVGGAWTTPVVAGFSGTWPEFDAFIDRDGKTVWFTSFRPRPGDTEARADGDIWKVTRTASGGWTTPVLVPDVNSDSNDFYPSLTRDGVLYFNTDRPGAEAWDLFVARPKAGGYHPPVRLPGDVNTAIWEFNPSPSPNGFLLAFASLDPDPAAPYSDVFFSAWTGDGYSARVPAGTCVNSVQEEYHPTLDLARGRLIFVRNDPFSPNYPQGDFYSISLPGALLADAE